MAYEEEETRSLVELTLLTLGFTLAAVVFACIALAAVVALPLLMKTLYLDAGAEWFIALLRWPILALTVAALVAVIYRYGPRRAPARWTWLSFGSIAASILWLVMSAGFSWYVSRFGSYNETYGSLGAVIGFMTWLWMSFSVILLGAELNAEIERQTARDTTTGPPLPLGTGDAEMADTVGPSP